MAGSNVVEIGRLVVECVGRRRVVTIGLVVSDRLAVVGGLVVVSGLVSDLVEAGLVTGCVVSGTKSRIRINLSFNRYRRKHPKVDASIFDSELSHTRRSDASQKREENSVSTFGRFRLWTSFESSTV